MYSFIAENHKMCDISTYILIKICPLFLSFQSVRVYYCDYSEKLFYSIDYSLRPNQCHKQVLSNLSRLWIFGEVSRDNIDYRAVSLNVSVCKFHEYNINMAGYVFLLCWCDEYLNSAEPFCVYQLPVLPARSSVKSVHSVHSRMMTYGAMPIVDN